MPRPDDHSDGSSTLPSPELNPLLNPLLAQNMGRWAEVYFTSPPEKREQAVLDLLRDLQGDNPTPEIATQSPVSDEEPTPSAAPVSLTAQTRAETPTETPAALVYCHACGRENPASHRFCGMCGTRVDAERSAADLNITDLHVADFPVADFQNTDFQSAEVAREDPRSEYPPSDDRPGNDRPGNDRPGDDRPGDDRPGDDRQVAHLFAEDPAPLAQSHPVHNHPAQSYEEGFVPSEDKVPEPAWNRHESLPPRSREFNDRNFDDRDNDRNNDRDNRPSNLFEPAPASRPYGLYAGIAVVVVLGLAYVAWRSLQTPQSSSPGSRVALQSPPVETTQPAASSPLPTPSKADSPESVPERTSNRTSDRTPDLTSPANTQAAIPANGAADPRPADSVSNPADAKASPDAASQVVNPTGAIDDKSLQSEPGSANGAQELAMAQRYLSRTEGQERNSSEAAKWLWKAIGKHNADASLLLSDLYLKGDGVEKNCDQARVLLDAAAGRGIKGAGDRLRHLQAFGCP